MFPKQGSGGILLKVHKIFENISLFISMLIIFYFGWQPCLKGEDSFSVANIVNFKNIIFTCLVIYRRFLVCSLVNLRLSTPNE